MLKGTKAYTVTKKNAALNEKDVFFSTFDKKEVRNEIIRLNTREQLYDKGQDAKGLNLGEYSEFTVVVKIESHLPYDRVTLYQEGDFYASFKVSVNKNFREFTIEADTIKDDGKDLQNQYGRDILGLSEESKDKLRRFVLSHYIDEVKRRILQ